MKYKSTRDSSRNLYSFEDAICSGYAPDGGLFVPETIPEVFNASVMNKWKDLSFTELAVQVLMEFVDDIPADHLRSICRFAFQSFPAEESIIPIREMKVNSNTSSDNESSVPQHHFIAELFHGPTFCFKDFGMRAVIGLLNYYANQRQRDIVLLVSTTGDTGPAAVQAVADLEQQQLTATTESTCRLKIIVHFPKGQISEFQKRQMTTIKSHCVKVIEYEGSGDDMDQPIKNIQQAFHKAKEDGSTSTMIVGVNSYNIGRPVVQAVHFFYIYLRIVERMEKTKEPNLPLIDFVVPTGAMGNIMGAYFAKSMGLPVGKIKVGVNDNDITHRAIMTGDFSRAPNMIKTLSDAINIQVPYNFERILYYMAEENPEQIQTWYSGMATSQKIQLQNTPAFVRLQDLFESAKVADDEMCCTLRQYHERYRYLCDPHTAVALTAAQNLGLNSRHVSVVIATASPCKFEESVTIAVGKTTWIEYFEGLMASNETFRKIVLGAEQPVVEYSSAGTLEESQTRWEESTKNILQEWT